jgi:aryl-alcohol dehydrogenase-like predicted oxidoreductase
MADSDGVRLGLGGHSFIEQLGNDPRASFEEQCALVAECLDNGVTLIDTTYYQERVALGEVLRTLGRRDEAHIMAWNFFKEPGREDDLVPYTPYEPQHLGTMLDELQTDRVDILVIHAHADAQRLAGEMELARGWRDEGKVGTVALGMAELQHLEALPPGHPIEHVLAPYNAFNRGAEGLFRRAGDAGMQRIALSPFIRGWKLDEIGGERRVVSDHLLRWVASQPVVDRVIVSMRKAEYVRRNLAAVAKGPLTPEEEARVQEWVVRVG